MPILIGSEYYLRQIQLQLGVGGILKIPVPPPPLNELIRNLAGAERFLSVLGQVQSSAMAGEYLAWDKLRHKQPPGDLNHEEWWFALRFARNSVRRDLALLRQESGKPFSYTLPDVVLESMDEITRKTSGEIAISELVTNPATRDRYLVSSLIEEAITSSQLEGAVTTRQVAKEMLRTGRSPKTRSERMILNNYRAIQRVTELINTPLTPDLVCEIHRIVTEGTLDNPAAVGALQTDDAGRVAVWGNQGELLHRPPAVAELPERLERLCKFANGLTEEGYVPPVLRSIAIHFMFGYDHYFEDGNGRTARALFYWSMLRQGYWLAEFLTISRILKKAPAQYARSFLLTEQDEGDLTHFFSYQLDVLSRAITELYEYLAKKTEDLRTIQNNIRALPGEFNYRQLALLEHAIRTPDAIYSAHSQAMSNKTSLETARQDLSALEKRGFLERRKSGKRFVWVAVRDLAAKLNA